MSKVVKTAASALSERCVLGSPPAATVPFIQGYGEIQVGHAVGGGAALGVRERAACGHGRRGTAVGGA